VAKAAIIVESPTKTRTLGRFLGEEYTLLASMGHVRDLPETGLAVDVEKDFAPEYEVIPRQQKNLTAIRKALKAVDTVYLASDPDREGEAIAWHLKEALKLKTATRIEFNEITEKAVREALAHPREIDGDRVNAQQARRVLDRLVGYLLSPLLWQKIPSGKGRGRRSLSAGRVQSVALRLIVDREREIAAFNAVEYWSIECSLTPFDREFPFTAKLLKRDGQDLDLTNETETLPIAEELRTSAYQVGTIDKKERRRGPQPPFNTASLQRGAANALSFSAQQTMLIAQQLYEGIETDEGEIGLITYMRTDSTRIADVARDQAREFINGKYGEAFVGPGATGKAGKNIQDAHEAVRPTSAMREPEQVRVYLDDRQFALYDLIWRRFVASQMSAAVYDQTTVEINAGRYGLRASGSVVKFAGFLAVQKPIEEGEEEEAVTLPELSEGQDLRLLDVLPEQHFTKPPPRYSEATLVQELEENGIGRPSTYAPTIEVLRQRKYVSMDRRRFIPTVLGVVVCDYLVEHFPQIMDVAFTAHVEDNLDGVESGERDWVELLREFYDSFVKTLHDAETAPPRIIEGEVCPDCGGRLQERYSVYGKYAGCENYPECKYTRNLLDNLLPKEEPQVLEEACPDCGKPLVVRPGAQGRKFVACSGYPECKYRRPLEGDAAPRKAAIPTDVKCPKCGEPMVIRESKRGQFLGCSAFPKCRTILQMSALEGGTPDAEASAAGALSAATEGTDEPAVELPACDKCGAPMVLRRARGTFLGCSRYPECKNTMPVPAGIKLPDKPKPVITKVPCPECGKPMVVRQSKRGKFLGCSGYPKCRHIENVSPEELESILAKASAEG
jgi:DNA topoisomerase-1